MRTITQLMLATGLCLSSSAFAAGNIDFDGSFSEARSTGPDCDQVFAEETYHARHAITGPSRRTSVLKFTDVEGEGEGFLHGLVLVGLLGGSNDLFYDKTLATDRLNYEVHAEGFVDYNVLYLEFEVSAVDADDQVVCKATATYSAFN